jgi:dTDP-glucose pyrophosphorylase
MKNKLMHHPSTDRWKELYIDPNATLIQGLKQMDAIHRKLLILFKDGKFRALLSIGDIQRAIIQNKPLESPVLQAVREQQRFASPQHSNSEIESMMIEFRMELCPVVDAEHHLIDVHFWEDLFPSNEMSPLRSFDLPVVIMAGGLGTRLRPLTQVLPKPLIPVGEKTMLEEIIDRFVRYGCKDFHLSVNYKAEMIRFYMDDLSLPVNLHYHKEYKPLGTGGSLSLMRNSIKTTFFVSNCDILIKDDYSEILEYHNTESNEITIVSAIKNFPIAYGTLETDEGGRLISIQEKPELNYKINTGMYILEPHLLDVIPNDTDFPITELIESLVKDGKKVGVYPVSEKSWTDIGELKLLRDYLYNNQ